MLRKKLFLINKDLSTVRNLYFTLGIFIFLKIYRIPGMKEIKYNLLTSVSARSEGKVVLGILLLV